MSNPSQFAYSNLLSSPQQVNLYCTPEHDKADYYYHHQAQIDNPSKCKVKSEDSYSDSFESSSEIRESQSSPDLKVKSRTSTPSTGPEDLTIQSPPLSTPQFNTLFSKRNLSVYHSPSNSTNEYSAMNSSHHAMSAYLKSNPYAMNGIAGITSSELLHSSVGYPGKYTTLANTQLMLVDNKGYTKATLLCLFQCVHLANPSCCGALMHCK